MLRPLRLLVVLLAALPALLAGAAPATAATARAPVVVIGFGGVRWSDVDPARTPALSSLAEQGAIGDVAVRSVRTATCPVDGWLTLSAGRRAADADADAGTAQFENNPPCHALAMRDHDLIVAAWPRYLAAAKAESYGATPGLLGDALQKAGLCATTSGPGAQIAVATSAGASSYNVPDVLAGTDPCPLTVVDAGAVRGYDDMPGGQQEQDEREPGGEHGERQQDPPHAEAVDEPAERGRRRRRRHRVGGDDTAGLGVGPARAADEQQLGKARHADRQPRPEAREDHAPDAGRPEQLRGTHRSADRAAGARSRHGRRTPLRGSAPVRPPAPRARPNPGRR